MKARIILIFLLFFGLIFGLYLYMLPSKAEDGRKAAAESDIRLLSERIQKLTEHGNTVSQENWISLVVTETQEGKFQGITYSNGILLDPWHEAYSYEFKNGSGHIRSRCLELWPNCSSKFR